MDEVLIEKKAQGTAVVSRFQKFMAEATLLDRKGRPIVVRLILLETDGGKAARGRAALPRLENGLVHLHDGAGVEEWVGEVCGFPKASRDDRFDDLTQMINWCPNHDTAEQDAKVYANMGAFGDS